MKDCTKCHKIVICTKCHRKLCTPNNYVCLIEGYYCVDGVTCVKCYSTTNSEHKTVKDKKEDA